MSPLEPERTRLGLHLFLWSIAGVSAGSAAAVLLSTHAGFSSASSPIFILLSFVVLAPVVNVLHRRAFRAGGIAVAAIFLVFWALAALGAAEWIENSSKWAGSMSAIVLTWLPGAIALLFAHKPWGKVFAIAFASLAFVAGGLMLYPIWFPAVASSDRFAQAGLFLVLAGACGSTCLINVGRGDRRYFRWLGLAAAMVAGALLVRGHLLENEWNSTTMVVGRVCLFVAGACGVVNMVLMTRKGGLVAAFKWAAVALSVLLAAVYITWTVVAYRDRPGDLVVSETVYRWLDRTAMALLCLTAGAIVCELLARTILRITAAPRPPAGISGVALTCPHCQQPATLSVGSSACPHCRMNFRIQIFEPRCECGYLLLHATAARCPECGRTA